MSLATYYDESYPPSLWTDSGTEPGTGTWPGAWAIAEPSGTPVTTLAVFVTDDGTPAGVQTLTDAPAGPNEATIMVLVRSDCPDLIAGGGTNPANVMINTPGAPITASYTGADVIAWQGEAPTDVTFTVTGYETDGLTVTFTETVVYHFAVLTAAAGVEAGTPGRFTPDDADPPANIGELRDLGLNPGDPWAEGEHVVIGTGNAYWNGTDWAMGKAP